MQEHAEMFYDRMYNGERERERAREGDQVSEGGKEKNAWN